MLVGMLLALCWLLGTEQTVAPTFLYRHVPHIPKERVDTESAGCLYKPIFGEGDSETRITRSVARFGEVTVEPGGACDPVSLEAEEQIYVILEGEGILLYGGSEQPVRRHDFMYLPAGVEHGIVNRSGQLIRFLVFGYRLSGSVRTKPTRDLQIANIDAVPLQTVGGHPPDCQYRLLMGSTSSTRDRLASAYVLTSLFVMEFAPGGTNFPHHHEREEEIYFVLSGEGEMVAGGGLDGVEGRHPARAGDAYFFRLNCTVGFYAAEGESVERARILAARSLFPVPK